MSQKGLIGILASAGVLTGFTWAYYVPGGPVLVFWMVLLFVVGLWIALTPALEGLRQRTKWLLVTNAVIISVALISTQLAARRSTLAIHLRYDGVLLESESRASIGSADTNADIRLPTLSATQSPWRLTVFRSSDSVWRVRPIFGVEQLRIIADSAFRQSGPDVGALFEGTTLQDVGDFAVVSDSTNNAIDTLRLELEAPSSRVLKAHVGFFRLTPYNTALAASYLRELRAGLTLSALDGSRKKSALYERFVRIQKRQRTSDVLTVTAAPPFHISGQHQSSTSPAFHDSASVEVRQGALHWQFRLKRWRRERSAPIGLAFLFDRNPRSSDYALPTGINCSAQIACGAISLRRLPPPIPHIALDNAGFASSKYGLLGLVQPNTSQLVIRLARESDTLNLGASRPTAVPVATLPDTSGDGNKPSHHWLLLRATGLFSDDMVSVILIALGIACMVGGVGAAVASTRIVAGGTGHIDERAASAGIVAILGLLLTRTVIGARVTFFSPYAPRGIETAIGMWLATACVSLGLLTWSSWAPRVLVRARSVLRGHFSAGRALERSRTRETAATNVRHTWPVGLVCTGIGLFAIANLRAVGYGLAMAAMVLLSWVTVSWVAAFSGDFFETFEAGPSRVVEQLSPDPRPRVQAAGPHKSLLSGWVAAISARVPELPLIIACLSSELALALPFLVTVIAATLVMLVALGIALLRRRGRRQAPPSRDYVGAAFGASLFALLIALMKARSENGSAAAFVLIVFVALASVRIGRAVGARAAGRAGSSSGEFGGSAPRARDNQWILAALLAAPLGLLAPVAVIDMGLFLVVVLPIGFAALLAAGWHSFRWRLLLPGSVFLFLFYTLFVKVLFPSVAEVRSAESHLSQAIAFDRMARFAGWRVPLISTSFDRVAARALATRDEQLAEQTLVAAQPGPARDLLRPSIEQIWGARAYAHGGWRGTGLGSAPIGGRGVAEAVSYAENAYAVYVLAEHGAAGGLMILCFYATLVLAAAASSLRSGHQASATHRASRALFLVATLLIVVPAIYVALSNLSIVPITGQNMPFLGLNSWSDVTLCAGMLGIIITGALRRAEEPE